MVRLRIESANKILLRTFREQSKILHPKDPSELS